jgi:hypothetical protein
MEMSQRIQELGGASPQSLDAQEGRKKADGSDQCWSSSLALGGKRRCLRGEKGLLWDNRLCSLDVEDQERTSKGWPESLARRQMAHQQHRTRVTGRRLII